MCLDLDSFLQLEGLRFGYVAALNVKNFLRIRRIHTMRQPVAFYSSDIEKGVKSKLMMPKALSIPLASFNIDVNVEFVENPFGLDPQEKDEYGKNHDDRSTKIATPNVFYLTDFLEYDNSWSEYSILFKPSESDQKEDHRSSRFCTFTIKRVPI